MEDDPQKEIEIVVHGYDWSFEDGDDNVNIRGWCLDRESNPYLLRIEDFPVFCHMELPMFIRNRYYHWTSNDAHEVFQKLQAIMKDSGPYHYEFKEMPKLYYYRGERKYPMMLLCFHRVGDMQRCEKIVTGGIEFSYFYDSKLYFKLWETSITILRKFFTVRKTGFAQWFKAKAQHITDEDLRISTLEREYMVQWRTLTPISAEETKGWLTKPHILSFDIETYSDNHKAMPNKLSAKHVVFIVSCIYQQAGNPETRKRYAVIYGTAHDVEDAEIIRVNDELALIDEFAKLVRKLDPEILIGYNIFGFDYPYMDARLQLQLRDWQQMGRLKGRIPELKSKSWKSSAYGYNYMYILQMEGRISIDLLPLIRRSEKLDKYDLDSVSRKHLKKGKHDVKAKEMFEIFERMKAAEHLNKDHPDYQKAKEDMTKVLRYCIQDSELVIELFDKLIIWISLIEMSNVVGVTLVDLFTRGQQIRCLSQIYDFATNMGYVMDSREQISTSFEGGFVFDPIPGLYDNVVCFDFASLYPSIMQGFNICYTTLIAPELADAIPDDQCHVFDFVHEEPVEPKKKLGGGDDERDEYGGALNNEDDDDEEDDKEKEKIVKVHKKYKFIKSNIREGLIPQIVRNLVSARKIAREAKAVEKNPLIKEVLEQRQLALKTTANSMFGFLGVANGKLPLIEGAMCITAKGRELIGFVNDYLKKNYNAKIIYNDTDSSMVDLGIKDRKECNMWGKKLSEEISALFPPPIKIEFEKAMRMLSIRKKKYAAVLIDKHGEYKFNVEDILKRGIVPARRDNCKWLRNTYMELLMIILHRQTIQESFACIVNTINRILGSEVPLNELSVIREIGTAYKSDSFFMKIFSDELRRIGKPVTPGDRVEYVIIEANEKLLGKRMRSVEWYQENMASGIVDKIDFLYYIEKALMNPIDQLFYTGYISTLDKMEKVGYHPKGRHKFISIKSPVKMIVRMLRDGVTSLTGITDWFKKQVIEASAIYFTVSHPSNGSGSENQVVTNDNMTKFIL